ncbi:hypothetical protein C1922_05885 [Stenotrophomonas sp. ZAC14D2_NAIMI4_7]|nr:hypothetical protein C1922_05885 [Stenotrophomonas sp. ZAC14D2_NAIMI4_7]
MPPPPPPPPPPLPPPLPPPPPPAAAAPRPSAARPPHHQPEIPASASQVTWSVSLQESDVSPANAGTGASRQVEMSRASGGRVNVEACMSGEKESGEAASCPLLSLLDMQFVRKCPSRQRGTGRRQAM